MELSQRLNFETVTQCMSIKHEDENVGKQALATLNRLVERWIFLNVFRTQFLFVGLLIPLLWTSGSVCFEFENDGF